MSETQLHIDIDIDQQHLRLFKTDKIEDFIISTAKNGPGEKFGSECTPRGEHIIRAKIGADADENTVFIGRRPSGEIYTPELAQAFPQRDWILTRILWLSGREVGKNRLSSVDTMRRYIYIHGCPDSDTLGRPSSHGCIKMRNSDIIRLFDCVVTGTQVNIYESL